MPRRSSRQPSGEAGDRRSTRGAVAEAAAEEDIVEDPPAERPGKKAAESPSPTSKTVKKSSPSPVIAARPSRASRDRAKKDASNSENEEDVSEDDEEEYSPTKGRGKSPRGRGKSPRGAGGRGRGRGAGRGKGRGRPKGGKKKENTPSDSEDDEEIMEAEPAKAEPASRSKRTRAPKAAAAEVTEQSPKRRSSRGASQAATAAIKQVASQSEEEEEEEQEEEEEEIAVRGTKRKATEEEEYSSVKEQAKKPKVAEEATEPEPMETETEDADPAAIGDAPPSQEKAVKEVEPVAEQEEPAMEESAEEREVAKPAEIEKPSKDDEPEATPEISSKVEKEADKPEEKAPEPVVETNTVKQSDRPQSSKEEVKPEAPKPMEVASAAPPAAAPPAAAPPAAAPPAAAPPAAAPPAAAPPAAGPPAAGPPAEKCEKEKPVADKETTPAAQAEEEEKDFVMVEKDDVPSHDSSEVQKSLPPAAAAPVVNNAVGAAGAGESNPSQNSGQNPGTNPPVVNNTASKANGTASMNNVSSEPADPATDPLLTRKYIASKECAAHTDVSKHFTVASYNILAPCHASNGWRSGSQYAWTSEEKLSMDARHPRLSKELQYLAADVLCLQEVEPAYFDNVLVPELRERGYEGKFMKRLGDCNEGEATFYRKSRFTLVESKGVGLRDLAFKELESASLEEDIKAAVRADITEKSNSVVLLTKLRSISGNQALTVGNIHVTWGRLMATDIQCVEVACAIKELVTMAGGAQNPHVICGDFNSPPSSPAHQLTLEGYLNDDTMAKLQALDNVPQPQGKTSSLVNLWWKGFQHTSTSLKSTYNVITGTDPMSSCFPHDSVVRAVDYQWYSSAAIVPLGVLQAADPGLIQAGIPNAIFPSDHLSTKARFTFM